MRLFEWGQEWRAWYHPASKMDGICARSALIHAVFSIYELFTGLLVVKPNCSQHAITLSHLARHRGLLRAVDAGAMGI